MRVLSFDQSLTATAAVLLETESLDVLKIEQQWMCRPKSKGIYRMMEIRVWMDRIRREAGPDMLVRELHHMRQFGSAGGLQALTAILDMLAYEGSFLSDHGYAIIAPGTWKKFCLGKGNLKKDTAYLMHINRFLTSTPMLSIVPGFEVEDDNIADAICMGITGYFGRRAKLGESVPGAKATITALKKATDNMFEYGQV